MDWTTFEIAKAHRFPLFNFDKKDNLFIIFPPFHVRLQECGKRTLYSIQDFRQPLCAAAAHSNTAHVQKSSPTRLSIWQKERKERKLARMAFSPFSSVQHTRSAPLLTEHQAICLIEKNFIKPREYLYRFFIIWYRWCFLNFLLIILGQNLWQTPKCPDSSSSCPIIQWVVFLARKKGKEEDATKEYNYYSSRHWRHASGDGRRRRRKTVFRFAEQHQLAKNKTDTKKFHNKNSVDFKRRNKASNQKVRKTFGFTDKKVGWFRKIVHEKTPFPPFLLP